MVFVVEVGGEGVFFFGVVVYVFLDCIGWEFVDGVLVVVVCGYFVIIEIEKGMLVGFGIVELVV